jgi:hypothetical protein
LKPKALNVWALSCQVVELQRMNVKLPILNANYSVNTNRRVMDNDIVAPKLIDPTAIDYLDGALKKSHHIRVKYHRILWNVGLVCAFLFVFGAFLYYRYTNKPTPAEANYKLIKDQEFVLSKIRHFQEQNQKMKEANRLADGSELTGLPVVHSGSNNMY